MYAKFRSTHHNEVHKSIVACVSDHLQTSTTNLNFLFLGRSISMSLTCSRFLDSSDISNILGLQLSAYDSRELSVSLDLVLCNGV
uniref:Uncharacterized protein n=1 Tax=Physcomitrium patens TaxID=3218 RepID=A0A2K1JKN9_PHYPA|nr:hypothetical protein PHYPA_016918 [Physcomitrium patens]